MCLEVDRFRRMVRCWNSTASSGIRYSAANHCAASRYVRMALADFFSARRNVPAGDHGLEVAGIEVALVAAAGLLRGLPGHAASVKRRLDKRCAHLRSKSHAAASSVLGWSATPKRYPTVPSSCPCEHRLHQSGRRGGTDRSNARRPHH